jgi:hypothetical protein
MRGIFLGRLGRALAWTVNSFRADDEPPVAAVRDWLKIIIPVAAGIVAYLAFDKQSDQLRTQGDQLKTQGEQLMLQAKQLEQATRGANIALASRLSSQLVDIQNTRWLLGRLASSFQELMRMRTTDFFDGQNLNPPAVDRARETIARVREDQKAVEAATHSLPFEAFRAVRKMYEDTNIVGSFEHDLRGLEKDGIWELPKNPDPVSMEWRKREGYPAPKLIPRFADKWAEIFRDALRHNIEAVGHLQTAQEATEKRLAEIEKAINTR